MAGQKESRRDAGKRIEIVEGEKWNRLRAAELHLPECRWKGKVAHGRAAQKGLGQQDQWASQKVTGQLS